MSRFTRRIDRPHCTIRVRPGSHFIITRSLSKPLIAYQARVPPRSLSKPLMSLEHLNPNQSSPPSSALTCDLPSHRTQLAEDGLLLHWIRIRCCRDGRVQAVVGWRSGAPPGRRGDWATGHGLLQDGRQKLAGHSHGICHHRPCICMPEFVKQELPVFSKYIIGESELNRGGSHLLQPPLSLRSL